MSMRLTKIKYKKGITMINWETFVASTKNWDKESVESADKPRPELLACLKKWDKHIQEICELPAGYETKITAAGLSVSYDDNGDPFGIVVSGTMALETNNAPLCLNTPFKPFEVGEGMPEYFALDNIQMKDFETLQEEAFRYISGDRAQQSLFPAETLKQDYENGISHRAVAALEMKALQGAGKEVPVC